MADIVLNDKEMRLLQKYRENRYCRHTRESGYPEVFDFKEYWIPDKNLGNDEYRLLQELQISELLCRYGFSIHYMVCRGHSCRPTQSHSRSLLSGNPEKR